MTILSQRWATGLVTATIMAVGPIGAIAQTLSQEQPRGSFSFSGLGTPMLDNLPLEMAANNGTAASVPPLSVTDMGVTAVIPVIEEDGSERLIIRNTWATGVYR